MLPLLTMQPGDWYDADAVEHSIAIITDALGNRGYAFVEVKPQINRNRDSHTIDMTFDVQEGPQVYVERIDITGNVRTLDKVIRREMRLVEGDAFNTDKMKRSKERIKNLGFFKKVEVTNKAGLGARPDRRRGRGRRAVDRPTVVRPRLLVERRPAGRCVDRREELPRSRRRCAHRQHDVVPLAAGRSELYRPVFPRQDVAAGWDRL